MSGIPVESAIKSEELPLKQYSIGQTVLCWHGAGLYQVTIKAFSFSGRYIKTEFDGWLDSHDIVDAWLVEE